jgi:hypothetical protein
MKKVLWISLLFLLFSCGPSEEVKKKVAPLLDKWFMRSELFFKIEHPTDRSEREKWTNIAKEHSKGDGPINQVYNNCSSELANVEKLFDCQIGAYEDLLQKNPNIRVEDSRQLVEKTCGTISSLISAKCHEIIDRMAG